MPYLVTLHGIEENKTTRNSHYILYPLLSEQFRNTSYSWHVAYSWACDSEGWSQDRLSTWGSNEVTCCEVAEVCEASMRSGNRETAVEK